MSSREPDRSSAPAFRPPSSAEPAQAETTIPGKPALGTGRCSIHPHSPAIGTCDNCGRELCLSCAIPFRGRVLGTECASAILGQEPPFEPAEDRRTRPVRLITGIGFAFASAASVLAWKKFGEGSGPFGAWGMSPRWSILSAVAAITGLILWAIVAVARKRPGRRWLRALRILSVLVVAGAVLHLLRPPPFGPSSLGPWVAIIAGIAAFAGTFNRPVTPRQDDVVAIKEEDQPS